MYSLKYIHILNSLDIFIETVLLKGYNIELYIVSDRHLPIIE